MNPFLNLRRTKTFTHLHNLPSQPTLPILTLLSKRSFAGPGDEVRLPKDGKYKNVFNKRVSKCGRYTFYATYPHDYNEPWPFPPVYDKHGADLNRDPNWGGLSKDDVHAPPCSITGKPRRALGHYPWLGRSVVPFDDSRQYIIDDQVSPYPSFRAGNYESNRDVYRQWAMFLALFIGSWWFIDIYWASNVSGSRWRDRLWYREHMCSTRFAFTPRAQVWWSNPTAAIMRPRWYTKDRWYCGHENIGMEWRMDMVFIPAAKEDMYADVEFDYFDFKYWPENLPRQERPFVKKVLER